MASVVRAGVWGSPLEPWNSLSNFFGHLGPLFLGIPLSLLGSTMTVCGLLIQNESLKHDGGKEVDKSSGKVSWVPSWMNWKFLSGLSLYLVGSFLGWIALGIAPNTVLACLNSWNIVMGPILGAMWYGERVSAIAIVSATMLVIGCVWVACLGPRSYRLDTVEEINLLFAQIPFTACCITCGTLLGVSLMNYFWWRKCTPWSPVIVSMVSTVAAILATYSVLFAKCTSIIMQDAVGSSTPFSFNIEYQFYLWLAGTCLCGPLGLYFLHEALRHGQASFVIPVYQSLSTVFQLVVGGILFREYASFTLSKHLAFWPGVVLVIVSVVAFTRYTEQEQEEAPEQRPEAAGRPGAEAPPAKA